MICSENISKLSMLFYCSGVVTVDIDLDSRDVNQCNTDHGLFSFSDKCPPETTQCEHKPGQGLALGSYVCVCRTGFYFPNTSNDGQFYSGSMLESVYLEKLNNGTNFTGEGFQCVPCLRGCTQCVDSTPCMADYNILLRGIPLGIQSFCITVTLVIAVAVIRLRKTKVMVSGMWTLLEIILIGAVLLYVTVSHSAKILTGVISETPQKQIWFIYRTQFSKLSYLTNESYTFC
ncbi:probable G-protein coupled receptor 158 [Mizuhopecten yessoensis]|uniref:probable G-protein coupled receptor 158 n=1 Tax=Mizuhopecten yessoensis TaxID=6573 RepID=UPI000B45CEE7|nr:probable G-protein coupled receptor 158 [Mizuhopecten yessoensis]